MMEPSVYFQWPDYLVLAIVLASSAAIGFYYAFTGGKQKTTKEYLFANKDTHWLPISCSLLASYISSLNIISLPGEIYAFGTTFMYGIFFWPNGILIASKFYLPVFHRLKLVSVYRYVELRFGKAVKLCVTWASLLNLLVFNGLVIYGPAISISAVTGMNFWAAVALVTGVALLYTILGGMKAVLWTDTLQLVIMFVGIIIVFIAGTIHEGGPAEVYRVSKLSGRLDIFEWDKISDFDPRARHTLWNQMVDGTFTGILIFGVTQTSVMRMLSLKDTSQIFKTYAMTAALNTLFTVICASTGLIIFSYNRHCDPIKNYEIFSKDQYYTLFVMKMFGHLPGLPGFILSAIFSGSLSTVSSMVNSMATVVMVDVVKPLKPNMTDFHATVVTKVLSVVIGGVSILFVLFAMNFGHGLISMIITIAGVFGGPSLAVFTCGLFFPFVKRRAILIGFFTGAGYSAWTGIGGLIRRPYVYQYPLSTEGCNLNLTDNMYANISSPIYDPATWNPQSHYRNGVDAMYDISYVWAKSAGIIVTSAVAIVLSLTLFRNDSHKVNYRLISPSVTESKYLPQSWRDQIDFSEDENILPPQTKEQEEDEEDGSIRSGIKMEDMEGSKTELADGANNHLEML